MPLRPYAVQDSGIFGVKLYLVFVIPQLMQLVPYTAELATGEDHSDTTDQEQVLVYHIEYAHKSINSSEPTGDGKAERPSTVFCLIDT